MNLMYEINDLLVTLWTPDRENFERGHLGFKSKCHGM